MSQRMTAHISALRRELLHIQQATGLGLVMVVGTAILLGPTLHVSWPSVLVGVAFGGYTVRKVRLLRWAQRVAKQLLLESQFIQHGPLARLIHLCLHRRDHIWKRSLTLKGLKTLDPALFSHPESSSQEQLVQHYRTTFKELFPSRFPFDLLLLLGTAALWIWLFSSAYLSAMPTTVLIGLGFFCLVFIAEVTTTLLRADVWHGQNQLLALLTAWMISQGIEKMHFTDSPKRYRHTLLYRADTLATATLSLPAERLQELS